jgi:MFS family permease
MTILMILTSVLAGRWTTSVGARWSLFGGCMLFGVGLLLANLSLSPHPDYWTLASSLGLTGIGIGATVVPITSSALNSVPPERSGMAASATNTSREVGAVTGVAVLGALVNARLSSGLISQLRALGIPANFQSIVIHAVETGGVPSGGNTAGAGGAAGAGHASLVQKVIEAAYSAFQSGLRAALYLSAALVFAAGLLALVVGMRSRRVG